MLMPLAGCMFGANPVRNWPLSYSAALHNKPSLIIASTSTEIYFDNFISMFNVPVVEHEVFITDSNSYKSCKISGIFKAQAHPKM